MPPSRALHINQALDVTELCPPQKQDFGPHLGQCRYFTTDARTAPFAGAAGGASFVSLLVAEGQGALETGGETMPLRPGDSVFIPANSGDYRVEGGCRVLVTTV